MRPIKAFGGESGIRRPYMLRKFGLVILGILGSIGLIVFLRGPTNHDTGFVLDGDVQKWEGTSPSFHLRTHGLDAREGVIWIAQRPEGLIVAGRVFGGAPLWPSTVSGMSLRDHVEVWVADEAPPELPPVGWGNQFGYEKLDTQEDCVEFLRKVYQDPVPQELLLQCRTWFEEQIMYRAALGRLFVRRWQISPELLQEAYAHPAFQSFDASVQARTRPLEPAGQPQVKILEQRRPGEAYSFEVLIPWEAFPPIRGLDWRGARLQVAVMSAGSPGHSQAPYSTISQNGKLGDASAFVTYRFPKPRKYFVTPCDLGGKSIVIDAGPDRSPLPASDFAKIYFFPTRDLVLRKLVVVDNEGEAYQYEPNAQTRSPIALEAPYWTMRLGKAEVLCGPLLSYRRGATVYHSGIIASSKEALATRRLRDGNVLIKEGPRVWTKYFTSGQCGACPRVSLHVYHLDTVTGVIGEAFEYAEVVDASTLTSDVDIRLTLDWSVITVFEASTPWPAGKPTTWRRITYCLALRTRTYEECGRSDSVPAPAPRVFKVWP